MQRVFFVLLIFVFSCETVVELDVPAHDPLLVVNGIIETDSVASVFISNSLGAFDQGEINPIDDANVFLYENGSLVGEMFPDLENVDSIFKTWNIAIKGGSYGKRDIGSVREVKTMNRTKIKNGANKNTLLIYPNIVNFISCISKTWSYITVSPMSTNSKV